jgi:ribose/xylose/arabinose/galactoside ABC-type transport system permease subunit
MTNDPKGNPFTRLPTLSGPLLGLVVVLGIFVALFAARGELDRFLSLRNLQVLVHGDIITAVAALGMLLIMVSGGIDLSTGSVVALVTVVTMQVYGHVHQQTGSAAAASLAAIPAGVAVGGACGLANGLIITRLRLAPFVTTLGMVSIARGLAYWLAGRQTLNFPPDSRPRWVVLLSQVEADYTVFDPGFWILLALAGGVAVLLRYTVLGRYCYAIGSNEATARLCGVGVERCKVTIYTLAGLLTGWAGVLMFAHLGIGDPNVAKELELKVIAAVVIGGASLAGGQGTVLGTLLGVLILAILNNGVSNFQVPVEVQYILIGGIIIVNTALSRWQRRRGE